jgi:hypothetical protein
MECKLLELRIINSYDQLSVDEEKLWLFYIKLNHWKISDPREIFLPQIGSYELFRNDEVGTREMWIRRWNINGRNILDIGRWVDDVEDGIISIDGVPAIDSSHGQLTFIDDNKHGFGDLIELFSEIRYINDWDIVLENTEDFEFWEKFKDSENAKFIMSVYQTATNDFNEKQKKLKEERLRKIKQYKDEFVSKIISINGLDEYIFLDWQYNGTIYKLVEIMENYHKFVYILDDFGNISFQLVHDDYLVPNEHILAKAFAERIHAYFYRNKQLV